MILLNKVFVKRSGLPVLVLLFAICYLLFTGTANASALFFNPQAGGTVETGESFVVGLYLDTQFKVVNALDVTMRFEPDQLEVLDVSRGNSVISLWIQDPSFDNVAGAVRITGGIPGGGSYEAGLLGHVTLRAKNEGRRATLSWDDAPSVLLHDGKGSADAVELLETSFEVLPEATDVPRVSSRTHGDPARWYRETTLHVGWRLEDGAVYSYALDYDPSGTPDETPDTPAGQLLFLGDLKFEGLTDGVYYFHLRQGVRDGGDAVRWSRTRTFRAQIDSTPPDSLDAVIDRDPSVFGGRLFVSFAAGDRLSGVDHYEVWEKSSEWVRAKSPYELRDQGKTGDIAVRAVDKAGNTLERTLTSPSQPTPLKKYLLLVGVFVLGVAAGVVALHRLSAKRKAQSEKQQ